MFFQLLYFRVEADSQKQSYHGGNIVKKILVLMVGVICFPQLFNDSKQKKEVRKKCQKIVTKRVETI